MSRLDEWVALRDQGLSLPQAAAVLGISRSALTQAVSRARRRGDPRGEVLRPEIDREYVLEEWDVIWSHDTFEGCARRLGLSIHTLDKILVEARQAGDPRADHPYTYVRRRTA